MKIITKARTILRLRNRFGLQELLPEKLILSETVIPITNFDALLTDSKAVVSTVNVTGTGLKVVATVPLGKRWLVHIIHPYLATGNFTIDYALMRDSSEGTACMFDSWTAAASRVSNTFNPFTVEQNDTIEIDVAVYTTTGTLITEIVVTEEDAY